MYKHILVPTDGSPLSLKAAKSAAGVAKQLGAKVTALYVAAPWFPPYGAEAASAASLSALEAAHTKAKHAEAQAALGAVEKVLKKAKVAVEPAEVQGDRPWEAIIAVAAKRRCDLIVMSSHGRRGLKGLLLGSETVKVLTHSKTPVLVCR